MTWKKKDRVRKQLSRQKAREEAKNNNRLLKDLREKKAAEMRKYQAMKKPKQLTPDISKRQQPGAESQKRKNRPGKKAMQVQGSAGRETESNGEKSQQQRASTLVET